jgi:predicted nucleotidyltransferase
VNSSNRLPCCVIFKMDAYCWLSIWKNNCNLLEMYTLDAIMEKLRLHKPELQHKYPISQMGVFGSYAGGEATENSDIDIAVELNGPMGLNFVAMANEIEDLFGIKVDVVTKRSIKPAYLAFLEKDILYV